VLTTHQLAEHGVHLALTYATNLTAMNALVTDLQSKYADFERAVPDLREPLPVPSVRDQDIGSVAVLGVDLLGHTPPT
jgi:hypothetical protein